MINQIHDIPAAIVVLMILILVTASLLDSVRGLDNLEELFWMKDENDDENEYFP